jgi:hypothetical protein
LLSAGRCERRIGLSEFSAASFESEDLTCFGWLHLRDLLGRVTSLEAVPFELA